MEKLPSSFPINCKLTYLLLVELVFMLAGFQQFPDTYLYQIIDYELLSVTIVFQVNTNALSL